MVALCQEEEEEEMQTRPRPDTRPNPVEKHGVMTPMGQRTVADDGQHGDGLQPSMKPAGPSQHMRPTAPGTADATHGSGTADAAHGPGAGDETVHAKSINVSWQGHGD